MLTTMKIPMIYDTDEFYKLFSHDASAKVFGYFVVLLLSPVIIIFSLIVFILKITFGLISRKLR